jgi:hypothetical protein
LIVTTYRVPSERGKKGMNVAVEPEPLAEPATLLPQALIVKDKVFIVEGSMSPLKVARTAVSVATHAALSAGDVETIVKTDSPEA